jgi:hypothetical protein
MAGTQSDLLQGTLDVLILKAATKSVRRNTAPQRPAATCQQAHCRFYLRTMAEYMPPRPKRVGTVASRAGGP